MEEYGGQDVVPVVSSCQWQNLFFAAAILFSGMIIGGVITALFLLHTVGAPAGEPRRWRMSMVEAMQEKYDLTEEQAESIGNIFKQYQSSAARITWEIQPRLAVLSDQLAEQISAVLSPEQAQDWSEKFSRLRQQWRERIQNSMLDETPAENASRDTQSSYQ